MHPHFKGDLSEKMEFAKNADGILVRHTRIDDRFLSGMKKLKAVVRYGVGYDNVDIDACTRHYAWYSDKSMPELQRRAAHNLLNFLRGNEVEDRLC